MIKLSAIAAAAVFAFAAAPASAQDLQLSDSANKVVRVSLTGKSAAQISADVKTAAQTVCTGSPYDACIWVALSDAHHQLAAIQRAEARLAAAARPQQVASN